MARTIAKATVIARLAGDLLLSLLLLTPTPLTGQTRAYSAVEPNANPPVSARSRTGPPTPAQWIAAYGPFRVIDAKRAALVDVTTTGSPDAFATMLQDYPDIGTIEMVDCPGTEDDRANLRLGQMIRKRGLAMHVPEHGFVGSGAIELFLAGTPRTAEPDAEFAVHSWKDEAGREPQDYAADAPQNRAYLDYYRAMGLSESQAAAFYAMTNSVPFAGVKWLTQAEMAIWVKLDATTAATRR